MLLSVCTNTATLCVTVLCDSCDWNGLCYAAVGKSQHPAKRTCGVATPVRPNGPATGETTISGVSSHNARLPCEVSTVYKRRNLLAAISRHLDTDTRCHTSQSGQTDMRLERRLP